MVLLVVGIFGSFGWIIRRVQKRVLRRLDMGGVIYAIKGGGLCEIRSSLRHPLQVYGSVFVALFEYTSLMNFLLVPVFSATFSSAWRLLKQNNTVVVGPCFGCPGFQFFILGYL